MTYLSRRLFLGAATALAASPMLARSTTSASSAAAENPLVRQRADAQVFRHDGSYYMAASVPEYDRLIIRRSSTLAGLATADEAVVWRRPASGRMAGYIWAPELHLLDGRWHIYFAAGDGDDKFRIRTYVLRAAGSDPITSKWELLGKLETPWDTFTLDSTILEHRGVRYISWAQHEPGFGNNTNVFLAPLATPTTLAKAPARLTAPTLEWEIQGFKVNEGPAFLARNGRLFMTYSASATDARYCLGLLTAPDDADIMNPTVWTKSQQPVFVSSSATSVYGPGHNSFTVDEQGHDLLVYHGRDYEKIVGDPLFDPNRHTRIQRLYFRADGTPDFGIPVGNGPLPNRWSPLDRPEQFVRVTSERVTVGTGPVETTQFRQVPSRLDPNHISLVHIESPASKLVVGSDSTVTLAHDDGSNAFARRSSFVKQQGLADPKGVSFASGASPATYLRNISGALRLGSVSSAADRVSATFVAS
ncbi:family 43 glycosylhydrolase [Peristeroidobacter agariperforans]|uniref:family 43 glycosylhydrolase n=1 Tax=Peristeroidobacter agariperforans TaxID=268404 RepID=UPI00101CC6C1